jgi:uncharacterized repeat protein (TIGR03806 family)
VVVEPTPQEIAAACGGGGGGINWGAVEYNCPNLSDWGLFPNGPLGDPAAGGVPFDLINSLHSDYALKRRVAFVPPGEMASYRPNDPMDFPDDTIIAKTFYYEQPGNAQRIVETRLLIRRSYGWEGLPYIWNGAETEAALALGGGIETLTLLDRDGDPHTTDYEIPGAADCGSCHFGTGGDLPIGPKARNLNHDFDYGGGLVENQLLHWELAGILQGSPGAGAAPRAADAFVPASGTLDERARAYLDVNCMHCHNPLGRAGFTGMWLEPDRPFGPETGKCKTPVAAGSASLGLEYDIVPGDADMSILVKRLDSVAPSIKMPELAKSIVHDEGVALITDWVDNFLSGGCNNP